MSAVTDQHEVFISFVQQARNRVEAEVQSARRRRDWVAFLRHKKRLEELERLRKKGPQQDLTGRILALPRVLYSVVCRLLRALYHPAGWSGKIVRHVATFMTSKAKDGTLLPRVDQLRIHWLMTAIVAAIAIGVPVATVIHRATGELSLIKVHEETNAVEFHSPFAWGVRYDVFPKTCMVSLVTDANPRHYMPSPTVAQLTGVPASQPNQPPVPAILSRVVVYKFVPCAIDAGWW